MNEIAHMKEGYITKCPTGCLSVIHPHAIAVIYHPKNHSYRLIIVSRIVQEDTNH
jgi:hypothetical protein